jgi:L-iditol 2-dehydrogenase
MRAVRYAGPRDVRVDDLPVPEIGAEEILVRVRACGLCATDVKTYARGHPMFPPGSVLGHEVSGVIARIGPAVKGWHEGERVVVAPYVPCGECHRCSRGHFTLCTNLHLSALQPGGLSEFVRVPAPTVDEGLLRIPAALTFEEAALSEPLGCVYHGFEAMDAQPGASLLIVGDGPMGLMQAMVARAFGFYPIVLSGMIPKRMELAAGVADFVVDVRNQNLGAELDRLTGSSEMDAIVVSAGTLAAAETGLAHLGTGGVMNLFAGTPSGTEIKVDIHGLHYKEQHVLGTFGLAPRHFRRAVDALGSREVDVRSIITRRTTLDKVQDALEAALLYEGVKTVVTLE